MNKNLIDWDAYKKYLISSIQNEKIWEMGDFNNPSVHSLNIEFMEEELKLLSCEEYDEIISLHENSNEYFEDFLIV